MSDIESLDYTDLGWVNRLRRDHERAMEMSARVQRAAGWDGTVAGVNLDQHVANLRAARDEAEQLVAQCHDALEGFFRAADEGGGVDLVHEDDECPMDDTCGCPVSDVCAVASKACGMALSLTRRVELRKSKEAGL